MIKQAAALLLLATFVLAENVHFSSPHACAFDQSCQSKAISEWRNMGKASSKLDHTVIFAVKMKDNAADSCDSVLTKISTPGSSHFGRHLSLQEVGALLSNPQSTQAVEGWLNQHGLPFTTSPTGDFIKVQASVAQLETLLGAQFHQFYSPAAKHTIKRTNSFSLPSAIAEHVDFVGGTTIFPPVKARFLAPAALRQSGNVSPQLIYQVYGISNAQVTSPNATQALFEALGQDFSPSDLSSFQQQFNLQQQAVSKIIGPNDPSTCGSNPNDCGEANLDVQYIMAIAQNARTTYWSIDSNANDPFLDWVVALSKDTNPPLVHSISYGSIAAEDSTVDRTRFNTEICKLGLRGVTVLVSSGDDGVANFEARQDPSQCGFSPSFPATSPYVTAVGATMGPEFGHTETACTSDAGGLITTGGGFSQLFTRPAYQAKAVSNYLKTAPNLPPLSQFSPQGRAYPDVAVLGHNYNVVIGGQTYIESGTSASSPVFAGMITLINDARIRAGKSALGFLNIALYQYGDNRNLNIFNDITVGENNCCAGNPGQQVCCQYGFNATTGWDPLTGWGSVNFPNLKKALVSL